MPQTHTTIIQNIIKRDIHKYIFPTEQTKKIFYLSYFAKRLLHLCYVVPLKLYTNYIFGTLPNIFNKLCYTQYYSPFEFCRRMVRHQLYMMAQYMGVCVTFQHMLQCSIYLCVLVNNNFHH